MGRWDRFRLRVAQIPPLVWAGVMVLVVLSLALARSIDGVARMDATVVRVLQTGVAVRDLERHVFAVTDLAGSPLLLVGLAAVWTLALMRRLHAALTVTLAVALTKVTVALIKDVVERPRPRTAFESYGTFSFPSGHAASAAALYMTLAVLVARGQRGVVRALVTWLGALLTVAVGVSRVLLGAHFPTDVLAGWCVGGLLGLCSWALVVRLVRDPPRAGEMGGDEVPDVLASSGGEPPPRHFVDVRGRAVGRDTRAGGDRGPRGSVR